MRVYEVQEDCPWIETAMRPLRGMSVPVEFKVFAERWREEQVVERLAESAELPPRHLAEGVDGLRRDLEAQGVFQRCSTGA